MQSNNKKEPIKLFLDMDNVLVNTIPVLNQRAKSLPTGARPDRIPGIFRDLDPTEDAIASVNKLADYYDLYILTTAPWSNPSAWQDKVAWIQHFFGAEKNSPFYKKITMTHDKGLVHYVGGILIDDRPYHGASSWNDPKTNSVWIQYGFDKRLTWKDDLVPFLIDIAKNSQQTSDLKTAVKKSNQNPKYVIHGNVSTFKKENWE
ncbi:5' nucleotidase, NT5C type [Fructilactobacillus fructivorans]|uniref:Uncharacterized protein n=1 Tax=Fructilactobacillus fructivorans TaxID=1614 RepID=A0AAE6NZH4_9LACO|nr:hypothetical protein [Fructilactobacillus fructivorans]KRK57217.1 5(3)-deoxyribonucleotidase [Fructilactobacillus fructivorans]KRN40463.1 5(3)-deoxyribonucleotidase [Fructilactobacillus fructivorans]KRN42805.1 5(3)-deoxyribonucleotidase [Fructilactobacillus fructivorans]QFX92299.1 hypothetical protein LF543_01335 [Fructilactobacillus fructivorans]RDV64851.1 hypothetical protein DXU76_05080 [Fructilactobacillus fructivorans]